MVWLCLKASAKAAAARLCLVLCFALCMALCLGGCAGKPALGDKKVEDLEQVGEPMGISNELVGLFDDEREAREAAELYGIELDSFEYGVAVFICEGDPAELIEKGKKNGWPELSLNQMVTALDGPGPDGADEADPPE